MDRLTPRALAAATACSFLTVAAVALAAPDRSAELTSAAPAFEWDGGPLSGAVLGVDAGTDNTQVNLPEGGSLTVKLTDFQDAPGAGADFDIRLYVADAAGDPEGEAIGEAIEASSDSETLSVKNLKPGSYVVVVNAFATVEGTFHGKATVSVPAGSGATPAPSPTATATPPATPIAADQTPDAKLGKIARKPRSFAGTASDDKGVKKVEIALQLKKGSSCTQLTRRGTFAKQAKCDAPTTWLAAKGTTKWSYKLRRALKKGSYTVFARATDSAGQVQAGFTPANKRSFKVR